MTQPCGPVPASPPVIDAVVIPEDSFHPMVFSGMCLRCNTSELAPGCSSRNLDRRLRELRSRGLDQRVIDMLGTSDCPADLRRVEAATDDEISELNMLALTRGA